MTDFALPTIESLYSTYLDEIKARDVSIVTGALQSDSNVPAGAMQPNAGQRYMERYSGAAWQEIASLPCYGGTVGGTANAITLAHTYAVSALRAGQRFVFVATADNTGAVTLNVDSLGAVSVRSRYLQTLVGGEINNGCLVDVIYDGTYFVLMTHPALLPITTWAPTFGATGSMTYGTITAKSEYVRVGALCFWSLYATGTIGGSPAASDAIYFSLPFTRHANSVLWGSGDVVMTGGAGDGIPACLWEKSTSELYVRPQLGVVWSAGAGRQFKVGGRFRVA